MQEDFKMAVTEIGCPDVNWIELAQDGPMAGYLGWVMNINVS